MEAVSINTRVESIGNTELAKVYRRQAKTCQDIVDSLEKMNTNNMDFFIQTGGFEQIRMNEDEVKRRLEMARNMEGVL